LINFTYSLSVLEDCWTLLLALITDAHADEDADRDCSRDCQDQSQREPSFSFASAAITSLAKPLALTLFDMVFQILALLFFFEKQLNGVAALISEETKRQQRVSVDVAWLVSNFAMNAKKLSSVLEAEKLNVKFISL